MASQEKLFTFNLKYLFYVGLWPQEHWPQNLLILYKIYEVTLHVLSFIFMTITAIGSYQHKHDIIVFLSNLDKSLVSYNFVLKVIVFVIKRESVKKLITEIEYSGDKISEDRKKLMRIHVIFITIVSTSVVLVFSGRAFFKGEMSIEAWMPFDPMKNPMNLLLATQISALTFTVPCLYRSFAMQGIVCSIIIYICDQLIELQGRLRALKYSPVNEREMREEFKKIVEKHIRLMGYSNSMRAVFKEFFLIQNVAVTVELCLNAMMITLTYHSLEREDRPQPAARFRINRADSVLALAIDDVYKRQKGRATENVGFDQKVLLANFLTFLFAALINAYIFCYLGNELIIQSEGIAAAACESQWTLWPQDLQKGMLIVITVAQRPLQLSAGGMAAMSIETFGQALYNGYSFFAVLSDMVD